jgi:hypothetical protein
MIDFLLAEKILTYSLITGVFTQQLLLSFKTKIIEPISCKILPDSGDEPTELKCKSFLRDLAVWILLILILYLIYRFFENRNKN